MKAKLFGITLLLFVGFSSFANKGLDLGGDLGWECLGNGNYKFTITTFYACDSSSSTQPLDSVSITSNSPFSSIECYKTLVTDVTPYCGTTSGLSCTSDDLTSFYRVEYESVEIPMPGSVPATGWQFMANAGFRDSLTNSSSADGQSISLRANMYPSSSTNMAFPCFDSSPSFLKTPYLILSNNVKQSISFSNMSDGDLDSVVADWAAPWHSGTLPLTYDTNYSFNSPFPGIIQNTNNVVGQLSSASGFYSFKSQTQGRFATCIKLTSYRDGQKIAEVYRELAVLIAANPATGLCPVFISNVPFITNVKSENSNPLNRVVNTQGDTAYYRMNVYPGDTVLLKIAGFTPLFTPQCLPQNVELSASGLAMSRDSLYGDPNNSAAAGKAATLTSLNANGTFKNSTSTSSNFTWITEKVHVSKGTSNTYQFNIRLSDFNCPIPGVSEMTLRVTVDRPFALSKDSTAVCLGDTAHIDATGANTNLTWSPSAGVSMSTQGKFHLSPTASTFYTITDAGTGYSETVYVRVDNISIPQIGVSGNDLALLNANTYDSLVWTLNGAPIFSAAPHDKITPTLSGSYVLIAYNAVCLEGSNSIDTTVATNMTLNPNVGGTFNGVGNDNMSFGINVRSIGVSDLTFDYLTILMSQNNVNPLDVRFRIFDVNTNQVFFSDSVSSSQNGLIEIYGTFTLVKNASYFMSFYFGNSLKAYMYKALNWPVVTQNGWLSIANASKAVGNVSLPSQFSDSYPYIHFNFNGSIGIQETDLNVLELYPNPTASVLNLPEVDRYEILDLSGRLVLKTEPTKTVNVEALKAGAYIIRNSNGASNKFIKQ